MVRCDEIGVYHGHSKGVTMYDRDSGDALWSRPTVGWIGFGWQEESLLFASTAEGKVHKFTKKGDVREVYDCDAYLCSCASSPDGEYVFAGDQYGSIYCFASGGERLWKLDSGCGAAQSMQYFEEKLYVVTHLGFLGCIDASERAILAAKEGTVPDAKEIAAPSVAASEVGAVETTKKAGSGVVVECYESGGKLRVRVVSEGYDRSWNCQFPKALREPGARYVVEAVHASKSGSFYRAFGDIKKLVGPG
jgi:outer membrane protein assembly factor BamB